MCDKMNKETAWNVYNSGKRMLEIMFANVLGAGAVYDGEAFGFLLGYKNRRVSEEEFKNLLVRIQERMIMEKRNVYENVGLLDCLVAEFSV